MKGEYSLNGNQNRCDAISVLDRCSMGVQSSGEDRNGNHEGFQSGAEDENEKGRDGLKNLGEQNNGNRGKEENIYSDLSEEYRTKIPSGIESKSNDFRTFQSSLVTDEVDNFPFVTNNCSTYRKGNKANVAEDVNRLTCFERSANNYGHDFAYAERPPSKQDMASLAEIMKSRNISPPCYEIAKMYSTKAAFFERHHSSS